MSWLAIGSAVVTAAVTATTTVMEQNKQKQAAQDAQDKAMKDANLREASARKAQVFSQTEGMGQGSQGVVNMQVDKNVGDGTIKDTKGLTL